MKKKILFIFAFALLLFIFLNNNSFAASSSDLPSYVVSHLNSTNISKFESNSAYYIIFLKNDESYFYLYFSNTALSVFINNSESRYCVTNCYGCFGNTSGSTKYNVYSFTNNSVSNSIYTSDGGIVQANFVVYDSKTNDLLYSPTPVVYYNVQYNLNGGTGTATTVTVQEGQSINLLDGTGITPPSDMNFVGWATTSNASSSDVTSPYTPTEDITLYAVYEYDTSGFLQGIRNVISSITNVFSTVSNGFTNVLSSIGNILSYINPLSENFFGYKLVDLIKSGLQYLFIPDSDNFNAKIDSVKAKFVFVDSIKNTINGLMEIVQDPTNSAVFTINLGESKYFAGGSVNIIDFSWYVPYKTYGDTIICCFAYAFFFWRIFIHLPGIINGSGGAVDKAIEIEKNSRG